MTLEQVLEEFGLSERQAKVYLATLELGEASVQDIAEKANIERTGTYYLIESLIRKGIVSKTAKGKKEYYSAAEPEVIFDLAKRKKDIIEKYLPEFKALYNSSKVKPKVRLYEGMEGIKSIYEKTLELKKGEEVVSFTPFEVGHKFIGDWGHDYIRRRVARGIFVRDIAEDSIDSREHQKNDKEEFRKTRLVPKQKFPFTNEIGIFQDWVMVISYKEMIGLVIESKDIAQMMKAIFELAWLGAEKLAQVTKNNLTKSV